MGAHADENGVEHEPILESPYKSVPIPTLTTQSAVEYILNKFDENVKAGLTNWIVSSRDIEELEKYVFNLHCVIIPMLLTFQTNTVTGEHLTHADLGPMTAKVASFMTKRGMTKGDMALYLTSDVTRIYTIIIGVWRVGGVMYSSYPEDTQGNLLRSINNFYPHAAEYL
jgi:hypothetical protein